MLIMYNDTVKVANKIITYDDLLEIFAAMQEKLVYYKKINDNEEMKNRVLDYNSQNWTFKDNGSKLYFNVDFYDDTQIKFDNYNNFVVVFNNRLAEIKNIYVNYNLSYSLNVENKYEYYNQHICMWIYEHKMEIEVSLSSEDKKLDDVYELIKNKILNAPEKYDEVIKKKSSITTIVGMGIGFIPSLIIVTLLMLNPLIGDVFISTYITYPIICLILTFVIGRMISSFMLNTYYENIAPEKKYAGYDVKSGKSTYKDDIDKYVTSGEILIGKNIDNLESRKKIKAYKEKYKKWIPYELGIMILISIIIIFLGYIR